MNIGHVVEPFHLPATGDQTLSLRDFQGKRVVLFFYPKDNTSGCTSEAVAFANAYDLFEQAGAVVLGVSKDSIKSHEVFKSKYNLPFPLLSDRDGELCHRFGVIDEKEVFGRKITGIVRSTFLLDENGVLMKVWRKVDVTGHCQEVLEALGVSVDDRDLESCRLPT